MRPHQPPQRVHASSSLQLGSAFPPGFLTPCILCSLFIQGACLKERGKEGKDPRAHTLVNNEPLCSYSLMRPLAPQIPEQQQWGLAAASHLPPSLQPRPGSLGPRPPVTLYVLLAQTHCGPQGRPRRLWFGGDWRTVRLLGQSSGEGPLCLLPPAAFPHTDDLAADPECWAGGAM